MNNTNLIKKFLICIIENEKINNPNAIFNNDKTALNGLFCRLIKSWFAIIPKGIKYKPRPNVIDVTDTLIQFSFTIPEAIKTVPHTGGVIVDSKANQKINK